MTPASWRDAWTGARVVFIKELTDALRDRRTLLTVFISSVLMGPMVLVLLSSLVAGLEARAEQRTVVVVGIEHAPTLRNFIARQTFQVQTAPADYEAQLRTGRLADPVLVLPAGFEAQLRQGDPVDVVVVSDSSNRQAEAGAGRLFRLIDAFNSERGRIALALRGVPASLMRPLTIDERDLASVRSRAAQFMAMLPFFVIMAVVYGALNAALDTTAGERERGSLEPLLSNPVVPLGLVLGKWAAVVAVGMLIALVSVVSFLPAQHLIRSDTLRALFVFGWQEAALFLLVLMPLAATVSALMMAVAIRCKSFKEAQANNTVVILGASLLPLVTVFSQSGDKDWFVWLPALGQATLLNRVLRGDALVAVDVAVTLVVASVVVVASLWFVARRQREAAVR